MNTLEVKRSIYYTTLLTSLLNVVMFDFEVGHDYAEGRW